MTNRKSSRAFPGKEKLEPLVINEIRLRTGGDLQFLPSSIPGVITFARLDSAASALVNWDRIAKVLHRDHGLTIVNVQDCDWQLQDGADEEATYVAFDHPNLPASYRHSPGQFAYYPNLLMRGPKTVATHSGGSHPDDVFAVATLSLLHSLPERAIIRTRDPEKIDRASYVVDIGLIYDPTDNHYDHHQLDAPKRSNGTPYSAFGLVWRQVGAELVAMFSQSPNAPPSASRDAAATMLYARAAARIDDMLVRAIDALDNGLGAPRDDDCAAIFTAIAATESDDDQGFIAQMRIAQVVLRGMIKQAITAIRDYDEVAHALKTQTLDHHTVEIDRTCESAEAIAAHNADPARIPVYFKIEKLPNGQYGATATANAPRSFRTLRRFSAPLGGLSERELQQETGLPELVFVHKAGFYAVANAIGALRELIRRSL